MRGTCRAVIATVGLVGVGASAPAQGPALTEHGRVAGGAAIAAGASRLAVADGRTVRLIDVTSPTTPRVVGEHQFADDVLGLVMHGTDLYVANSHAGLHRLDLQMPAAPPAPLWSTRGQAVGVAVAGAHAVVSDNAIGFDIVETAAGGRQVGEYLGDGFPRGIGAVGDLVFVADQPNGLVVVDISTPASPTPVGTLSLGADLITRVVVPSPAAGDPAPAIVCVASAGAGLQVVDVSTPAAPSVVAPIPTAGPPRGVALHGHEAFVVSAGTLEIFDLSEPSRPTRVAAHDVGAPAGPVVVDGELVFVGAGDTVTIYRR